jgi:hypothetical protein
MGKMIWVNDKLVAMHFNDNMATGIIEVGYRNREEASRSLLNAMENDQAVMSIVLAAAGNYMMNKPREKKRFLEAINKGK